MSKIVYRGAVYREAEASGIALQINRHDRGKGLTYELDPPLLLPNTDNHASAGTPTDYVTIVVKDKNFLVYPSDRQGNVTGAVILQKRVGGLMAKGLLEDLGYGNIALYDPGVQFTHRISADVLAEQHYVPDAAFDREALRVDVDYVENNDPDYTILPGTRKISIFATKPLDSTGQLWRFVGALGGYPLNGTIDCSTGTGTLFNKSAAL